MSKGSRSRPLSVARDEYLNNWDKIFNKKKSSNYHDVISTGEYDKATLVKTSPTNQEFDTHSEDK